MKARRRTGKGNRTRFELLDGIILFFLLIMAILIVFPVLNVVATSFATQKEATENPLLLIPTQPTIDNYYRLFQDPRIIIGYKTTLLILLLGVPINMLLTTSLTYGLSRTNFPGAKIIFYAILLTLLEFFHTADEAIARGYRPCRVCHPLREYGREPEWIQPLLSEIAADPSLPMTDDILRRQKRMLGAKFVVGDSPVTKALERRLGEYFAGRRRIFDVPLDLRGTQFHRASWNLLLSIPYGQTRSYQEQAVGNGNAMWAVAQAAPAQPGERPGRRSFSSRELVAVGLPHARRNDEAEDSYRAHH